MVRVAGGVLVGASVGNCEGDGVGVGNGVCCVAGGVLVGASVGNSEGDGVGERKVVGEGEAVAEEGGVVGEICVNVGVGVSKVGVAGVGVSVGTKIVGVSVGVSLGASVGVGVKKTGGTCKICPAKIEVFTKQLA